jgi:hypothetical protein
MRVGLFTNNYLPFRGGVTTAVETLRLGLEGLGHRAWVFAPAAQHPHQDPPFVFRYPSIPADLPGSRCRAVSRPGCSPARSTSTSSTSTTRSAQG